jgi:signal transduction histidine kinase
MDGRREDLPAAVEQLRAEIDELRAQHRQLRAEADALLAAHAQFLAGMRLEMSTPLNAIIGLCELMKTEPFGPLGERYKDRLEMIRTSGVHLRDVLAAIVEDAMARRRAN